ETSEASSDEAAGTETPDAPLPARDAAPTAQRPGRANATERGQPQSGGDGRREAAPQPRVERVVADAAPADAAPETAAAEGAGEVKVSFVSYSRTAAPPAAPPVGAAAPAERAQAVTPPAPPPPPPAPAQHLKLIMEPSGLGAVSLHLSLADAQVSVDMETQRHETRHALESGRDKLVESLTGAGYDVAHVQVKTAASDGGFDVTRRDGGQPDTPSDRAQQRGDGERAGRRGDQDRRQENADDPHLRAHRSGGVFL
ncbi:MAG TPA: flagellar hook-length control protein FliK, partial [Beijerinckiaceae bacterium]